MKATINQIILDSLGKPAAFRLDAEQRLIEDLQATPVELLEIFATLSAIFSVELKAQDAPKLKKVVDIYAYINERALKDRLENCSETRCNLKYVRIFPGMAYKLGILSNEMVLLLESYIGFQVRQHIDFTGVKISGLYLMQYLEDGCQANCAFCVQSKEGSSAHKKALLVDNKLMRFPLPLLEASVKHAITNGVERICIQTVYNKNTMENLLSLVKALRLICEIPITACCIPVSFVSLKALKNAGLDRIFINYETATPELFSQVRGEKRNGPYRWEKTTEAIDHALGLFGEYKVGTHLQIGLGESQKEALSLIQEMDDKKVMASLIAFRPIPGTFMENRARSSHANFHAIQLGSYLIQSKARQFKDFEFDVKGNLTRYGLPDGELQKILRTGSPFRNRGGCPGCNRVYYETNPGERFYTYPRALFPEEIDMIEQELFNQAGKRAF